MNSRKNALGVYLYATAPVIASPTLAGVEAPPNSIAENFPEAIQVIWALALILGGVMALIGVFDHKPVEGLIFELTGASIIAIPAAAYGYLALHVNGVSNASIAGGLAFGLAVACAARAWQCRRILRKAVKG